MNRINPIRAVINAEMFLESIEPELQQIRDMMAVLRGGIRYDTARF